jgi:hypothetical protein
MVRFTSLDETSLRRIRHDIRRKLQQRKFAEYSHETVFNWKWGEKGFNRVAAVNHLISISGGLDAKYLEIGCDANQLFFAVACLHKVGVDPVGGGTHRMLSDEFFSTNEEVFDVIFIDGLHEYEQVHRDALNALGAVKVGGYVAFHDFLPASWEHQHVPRISDVWTGDCWKLASQLVDAKGVEFVILDIDHGVGVMKKLAEDWHIPPVTEDLKTAGFERFLDLVDNLPVLPFAEGMKKVVDA